MAPDFSGYRERTRGVLIPCHYCLVFSVSGEIFFTSRAWNRISPEEVHSYLEMLTDEKTRAGMSPPEARRRALIELGGVEQVKEQVREIRIGTRLETLFQDFRYGVRMLAKNPGFTAAAVLALALGIGANTAIFSVVYGVLFRPMPYSAAERLALVYVRFSPQNTEHGTMSIADYLDWKAQNHAFEGPSLLSHSGWLFEITGAGEPEQVPGSVASAGFSVFRRALSWAAFFSRAKTGLPALRWWSSAKLCGSAISVATRMSWAGRSSCAEPSARSSV